MPYRERQWDADGSARKWSVARLVDAGGLSDRPGYVGASSIECSLGGEVEARWAVGMCICVCVCTDRSSTNEIPTIRHITSTLHPPTHPEAPTKGATKGTLPSQFWTWKRAPGEEYRIRYQHQGDSGPVVICVHGFGGNCVSVCYVCAGLL